MTAEKNTALLRNAEISQQMELVRQEMRRQEAEMNELLNKTARIEDYDEKLKEYKKMEGQLKNTIVDLEEQMVDKNKVLLAAAFLSSRRVYCAFYFAEHQDASITVGGYEEDAATGAEDAWESELS